MGLSSTLGESWKRHDAAMLTALFDSVLSPLPAAQARQARRRVARSKSLQRLTETLVRNLAAHDQDALFEDGCGAHSALSA
jgi:hypothetical protein